MYFLLVYGWFNLTPNDYQVLGKHVAGSVSFISNMMYMGETGYFDTSSHEKWLLHTWSLSVEWQFYIIYPIIILLLGKKLSTDKVKASLVLMFTFSLATAIYTSLTNSTMGYYFIPMRAWEMIAGGLAYLYPLKKMKTQSQYFTTVD